MDLHRLVKEAYEEDLPSGDITTDSLGLSPVPCKAKLIAKQDLILSGSDLFEACFKHIDPECSVKWYFKNSDTVLKNQTVAMITGSNLHVLKAERVALNFVGKLSGIATLTRFFVKETEGTPCKILDTRKTTPLLRRWEKKAVLDGGGSNHRKSLSDMVMLKENHLALAGGIKTAVDRVRSAGHNFVEVECKNLAEVQECAELNVDRVMLDNMTDDEMKACLECLPPSIESEASGNMSIDRISQVAELGVDFISVGALTHSAPTADFSLLI